MSDNMHLSEAEETSTLSAMPPPPPLDGAGVALVGAVGGGACAMAPLDNAGGTEDLLAPSWTMGWLGCFKLVTSMQKEFSL